MAVRLTTLFRREDEHTRGRRGINHELRNRFGFSLIQAPLRSPMIVDTEIEVPAPRQADTGHSARRRRETRVPLLHGLG
ncbi:hypothetical protein G3I59_18655 [Amycolatopsis rubida]|uniref:Uncharacterized protein n=1 Tax=Amycolatopsis rubida TaxID=112413 RepID=A0A1I5DTH7_9PSEU|nr:MULTISPECIES: hypothetical protein [Amycolatopsis]MYW92575.1 hypothetical protein [Amycolatopsis rubida]NEC57560.1 hypothetical protein [Amycolatopsis rubida]OAP20301.1 hypothetical protein A4R44_08949 [Amycolatopsis sp. M39]SFO02410.1 hypothetical protein SAMN05421854_101344 [Amycolatopsis rubida]